MGESSSVGALVPESSIVRQLVAEISRYGSWWQKVVGNGDGG